MICAFVLELPWLFSFPKECSAFPFFDHRCCPRPATTSVRCSQAGYLVSTLSHLVPLRHVLFERPSLICLSVGFLSLILNLIVLPPRLRVHYLRKHHC